MNKQKLKSLIGPAVVLLAFIAYAAYILIGISPDLLYTAQDRNFYLGGSQFFSDTIARPFGVFQYVGAYLTQLFYHPALGASVLIAIWVAIVLAGVKAFRLKGAWCSLMILPAACLLTSIVDLGYWVYCLIITGYWFSESVALLCILLLLWAANATPRRYRYVWYVAVGLIGYPAFGWTSYIFVVCLALMQIRKGITPTWIDGSGITLAAVAPLIFRALLFKGISLQQLYIAGFPYFKTYTDESLRPAIPFFIIIGIFLALSLSGIFTLFSKEKKNVENKKNAAGKKNADVKKNEKSSSNTSSNTSSTTFSKAVAILLPLLVAGVSAYGVWTNMFHDDNYIYEMQMNRATMEDDWQSVISVAEKAERPSRTMVMLKNIALMNTGELHRSFELGNSGVDINNSDSLNLNLMQIAAPLIYYNYGKINYAMRWGMEFSVGYGFCPYYLKILARCAETTGEKKLAERYKDRLHSTTYYADWQPKPATPVVKELKGLFADQLDDDGNSCERYLLKNLSMSHNVHSPLLSELSLLYAMIVRNPDNFWIAFCDYYVNNKGKKIPVQYEEALCLFAERRPVKLPYEISISPETVNRYKAFMNAGNSFAEYIPTEKGVGNAMEEEWGRSYWWFNAFGRTAY